MRVNKVDLEAKLREIEGVATDVEEEVTRSVVSVVAIAGALVVGLVVLAVWRSRRTRIRVEVYSS